jgi:hypothetical protein
MVFISKHVITISEASSRLGVLSKDPPLSLFGMFPSTKRGLGT